MADLLLELYSEDIPARLQAQGVADLERLVTGGLAEAGVECGAAQTFVTPRRLALVVRGLPTHLPPRRDERKGPRVNAPDAAVEGFLRSVGLDSVRKLQTGEDAKGAYYVVVTRSRRQAVRSLLAHMIPEVIRTFPWPRSMRWDDSGLRWVRPLRSILCLFDGGIVSFEAGGLKSGRKTRGHPVLSPGVIGVRSAETYEAQLGKAHVCLDPEKRVARIRAGLEELAGQLGAEPVMDEALLREAAGQVEWPVMCAGGIDDEFMDLPDEFLTAVMRTHQQYFSFRTPGRNRFAFVADGVGGENVIARENIIAGNESVLRARLADMRFYWNEDYRMQMHKYGALLVRVSIHRYLGNMKDKIDRIRELSTSMDAAGTQTFPEVPREALLSAIDYLKVDLVTRVVREFPELQGIAGRELALRDGKSETAAAAIAEHYAPLGVSDAIPPSLLGQWVSFCDKLETLVSFFAIDEKPTGSGDPYALRRAALGIIRIMLEWDIELGLRGIIKACKKRVGLKIRTVIEFRYDQSKARDEALNKAIDETLGKPSDEVRNISPSKETRALKQAVQDYPLPTEEPLLDFFADRLKVYLRGQGMRHDVVDAVLRPPGQKNGLRQGMDDFRRARHCMEALSDFLQTDDGENLLAGYKRAANIVRMEEKKDGVSHAGEVRPSLLREPEERRLHGVMTVATEDARKEFEDRNFTAAFAALAELRAPIDAFFDSVTVNVEEQPLRLNRLSLLSQIEATLCEVADFSRIEGGDQTRRP